jgi:hypothetical protein
MLAQGYAAGKHSIEASLVVKTDLLRDFLPLCVDSLCEREPTNTNNTADIPIKITSLEYFEEDFTSLISAESYFEVKQVLIRSYL